MVNGRSKGNKAENEVCAILSAWQFPERWTQAAAAKAKADELPFRRRFTSTKPLDGTWAGAGDILAPQDHLFPWAVECKKIEGWTLDGALSNEKWPVWGWWGQCMLQADATARWPLLFFSRNRYPWLVMARLCDVIPNPHMASADAIQCGGLMIFDATNLSTFIPLPCPTTKKKR